MLWELILSFFWVEDAFIGTKNIFDASSHLLIHFIDDSLILRQRLSASVNKLRDFPDINAIIRIAALGFSGQQCPALCWTSLLKIFKCISPLFDLFLYIFLFFGIIGLDISK